MLSALYVAHIPVESQQPLMSPRVRPSVRRRKSPQWFGLRREHAEVVVHDQDFLDVMRENCLADQMIDGRRAWPRLSVGASPKCCSVDRVFACLLSRMMGSKPSSSVATYPIGSSRVSNCRLMLYHRRWYVCYIDEHYVPSLLVYKQVRHNPLTQAIAAPSGGTSNAVQAPRCTASEYNPLS